MYRFPLLIIFSWIIISITSCGNVKNLQYLQGSFDTARLKKVEIPDPVVQKGDWLGITVYSDDPLATAAVTNPSFNAATISGATSTGGASATGIGSVSPSAGSTSPGGFLVSQSGDIQIYRLGIIPVEGRTKRQIADTLALLYSNLGLLKNPFIEVRFLNNKVTVIGEVNRPGQYSIPGDKVSAFEAIGLAGDITVFGKRDNVLVIRETNGVRQFGRLNLKDPNVFLSPYYYLQQNDMIIVDVSRNKAIANDQVTNRTLSITTALLSVVAILFTIFRK